MLTFHGTDSHSSCSSSSSSPYSVGRGGAAGLCSSAARLGRNARELNYVTEGIRTPSNIEETELSSRKVAWVENIKIHLKKFKHRIIIAFCNMRLHCHFYSDDDTRKELKRTVRESQAELNILDSEQRRRIHVNQMREELEDRRYLEAGKHALRAGYHGAREGWRRLWKNVPENE